MDDATIDRLISEYAKRLAELVAMPRDAVITCEVCGGSAPEPHLCGCGGVQTVAEAIRHVEFEIGILANH